MREQLQSLRKELRGLRQGQKDSVASATEASASAAAFLAAVCTTYQRLYAAADQAQFPIQMMRVGEHFLDSLRNLEGIGLDKVLEVCAHVASGRIFTMPGLPSHPLRAGAGGAPSRVRASDGAQAWRCALQVGTASARRLHWWSLPVPGGAVEFANVGVHDRFDIPE